MAITVKIKEIFLPPTGGAKSIQNTVDKKNDNTKLSNKLEEKKKKKGKKDRCYRIAKRKYDVFPSAYASGAIVKCRQGKIWKGLKEGEGESQNGYIIEIEFDKSLDEKKNVKKEKKPGLSQEKNPH